MKRLILAALFAALALPALAQSPYPPGPPPPVPALPDSARQTTYTISGNTCTCSVGFQLYGDGTDYQNWVEVWLTVNGVLTNVAYNDPTYGWTITSPTGSLSVIPRPITDAVLSFNNNQTGTVVIIGARRPRRITEFSEGAGVPARSLNQTFNDLYGIDRETWDKINDVSGRGIFLAPGTGAVQQITNPAACSNEIFGFGSWTGSALPPFCYALSGTGNVLMSSNVPWGVGSGGTGATTANGALANLGLGPPVPLTVGGTGATTQTGAVTNLGLFAPALTIDSSPDVNNDYLLLYDHVSGTYKKVTITTLAVSGGGISGVSSIGGQSGVISCGGLITCAGNSISLPVQNSFYVGGTGANDSNDCLSATVTGGHGPCNTIQHATNVAIATNAGGNRDTVNLAAASFSECVNVAGIPLNPYPYQGPFIIYSGAGAGSTVWNGCNNQFGTLIANGPTDVAVQNLTIEATGLSGQSALYAQIGGKIEVFAGVWFGQANNCHMFVENAGSQIQIWDGYNVFANTTNFCHASATSNGYIEWNPNGFAITLNTPETYTEFFQASAGGGLYQDNNTFNTTSVTGTKFSATMNGWIVSGVGGCTNLPGSVAGSTSSGGQCQ